MTTQDARERASGEALITHHAYVDHRQWPGRCGHLDEHEKVCYYPPIQHLNVGLGIETPSVGELRKCLICTRERPWKLFDTMTGVSVCEDCHPDAKREDEQRIAALRKAAQQVVDDYLTGVPMLRVSITALRRALEEK